MLRIVILCSLSCFAALVHTENGRANASETTARQLSLEQCYRLALKNSPTLQRMRARVREAEADRRASWTPLKPSASITGSFTRNELEVALDPTQFGPPNAAFTDPILIQKQNQFGFELDATLPLFRGRTYQEIGVAKKTVRSRRLREVRSRQDYLLRVATEYYRALRLKEAALAVRDKVAVDRENIQAAETRLEVGEALRSDVMRAELVLTEDEQHLAREQNNFRAAKRTLAILIGFPGAVAVRRPEVPASPNLEAGAGHAAALRRRADLKADEVEIAAAGQARRAAWWSFLPTLDLDFLYRWQEAVGFAGKRGIYTLVLSLKLPIYQGGQRYAELGRARARLAVAQAERAVRVQQIAERIVQLEAELRTAESGLLSAEKSLKLAKVTAIEMKERYVAGTATQLDVLDTSQRTLQAQLDLTRSRYVRDLARLSLAHALGLFAPEVRRPS